MDSVFSNRDLVRELIKHSAPAVNVLKTSKAIREGEPCTEHFEDWEENGCPPVVGAEEEGACLEAIGGLEGTFCVSTYELHTIEQGWPDTKTEVPTNKVANTLATLLLQPPRRNITTITTFQFRVVTVTVYQRGNGSRLIIDQGFRKKVRCDITNEHIGTLLDICSRVGYAKLPCQNTNLVIPKRLQITVRRVDERTQQDFLLMAAYRW